MHLPFRLLIKFWERSAVKGRKKDRLIQDFNAILDRYSRTDLSILPLLRLTLPWLDQTRMFGLKETELSKVMIKALSIPEKGADAKRLLEWKKEGGDLSNIIESVATGRTGFYGGEEDELTVEEVDSYLDRLREDKLGVMKELVKKSTPNQLKWISRIILKNLRARYKTETLLPLIHPNAPDFFPTNPSLIFLVEMFRGKLPERVEAKPGTPVLPMLAMRNSLTRVEQSMKKKGEADIWFVETKYDGIRMMFHKKERKMQLFSRSGKDMTKEFSTLIPFIAMSLQKGVKDCILDGELLIWNEAEEKVEPFSQVRSFAAEGGLGKLPQGKRYLFMVFDVLYLNGVDVTKNRLKRRKIFLKREVLKDVKGKYVQLTPHVQVTKFSDVEQLFNQSMENEDEGIMVKNATSYYYPNTRNREWWLKLKPDYEGGMAKDVDLLVVGGFYGEGRRGGNFAAFLLAIISVKEEGIPYRYSTIGKVGGGINEDMLAFLTEEMMEVKMDEKPEEVFVGLKAGKSETPDVWIDPTGGRIFKINAAQVTVSEKFGTGITFRNPRVDEIRFDKGYADAMDKDEFNELIEESPQGIKREGEGRVGKGRGEKEVKGRKLKELRLLRQGANVDDVKVVSNVLEGKTFIVYSGDLKKKELVERTVASLGGKFIQYGNYNTYTHILAYDPDILQLKITREAIEGKYYKRGENYSTMTNPKLKDILKVRGDSNVGRKGDLIDRLRKGDERLISIVMVKPIWLVKTFQNKELEPYTEENTWWISPSTAPIPYIPYVPTQKKKKEKKEEKKKEPVVNPFKNLKRKSSPNTKGKVRQSPSMSPKSREKKEQEYNKLKVVDLKEELKKRGLPVSGKKADLVLRLKSSDRKSKSPPKRKKSPPKSPKNREKKDYSKMTVIMLKEELRARKLPVSGKKADLIARLEKNK